MRPLSQSHLTLLDTCMRKFKYVSFEALSGPSTYEQQATTQWGSQFHLLMQQRALDLPVEVMAGANSAMSESLTALAKAAPDVFKHLPASASAKAHDAFSQSEHRRTLAFNGHLLTVIYDLVVTSAGEGQSEGQIFDWKTHQRSPQKEQLQRHWQTRLYLYVLCETTDLHPEQLSMTYWFVRSGAEPSFYRFGYSKAQHQQTQQDLQRLTDRLTQMSEQVDSDAAFPKVAVEKGLCDRCLFNVRCDRFTQPSADDPYQMLRAASQLTVDSVEEVSL